MSRPGVPSSKTSHRQDTGRLLFSVSNERGWWRRQWDSWFRGFTEESNQMADASVFEDYAQACEKYGTDSFEAAQFEPQLREIRRRRGEE